MGEFWVINLWAKLKAEVIGMSGDTFITTRGGSVDEAVRRALRALNITEKEARIEVLREPKQGFLGFGCKQAKVKVTIKDETKVERELVDLLIDLELNT